MFKHDSALLETRKKHGKKLLFLILGAFGKRENRVCRAVSIFLLHCDHNLALMAALILDLFFQQ